MTERPDPKALQRALGEDLALLLQRTGMSGKAFAEQLGWQPSKVSKITRGKQLPSRDDIEAWARACNAADQIDRLQGMLRAIQTERVEWQHRMRGGMAPVQLDYNKLHAEAREIRYFETVAVPGPLQIRAYAERVLTEAAEIIGTHVVDIDAAVATRLQRQQYLYEPSHRYTFLLAEPVLRWGFWPADVMRAQLDRLITAAELPTVMLAILPLGRPIGALPQNSFVVYDDVAIVDTATTELVCRDDEAAAYGRLFDRLMADAIVGDGARELIRDAAAALPRNRVDDVTAKHV